MQSLRVIWQLVLAQLANVLSTEALFYACIFPFIAFFGSFAFILYPLRDTLHPTGALPACTAAVHRLGPVCSVLCSAVALLSDAGHYSL